MDIRKETVFHGPNFLAPAPMIGLLLAQAGGFSGLTEQRLRRLVDQVTRAIQSAGSTADLGAVDWDLLRRAPLLAVGEVVARTALALQAEFQFASKRALALAQGQPDQVLVAYEFVDPTLGLLAGREAVGMWTAALGNPEAPPRALQSRYDEFKQRADTAALVVETRLLLQEARRRDIPWARMADNTPIFLLGQGAKQRRFHNSLTSETTDMAYRLASIKPVAARLLRDHGIPVPTQAMSETLEQTLEIARRIGFPVVIKPVNQDRGTGVSTDIANEAQLAAAYPATRAFGTVQVEKHLQGFDYRFTFVRGALVGVLCTMPPIIFGDGQATVRQLLEAAPVTTPTFARRKVIVDDEVLRRIADRGYSLDSVLPSGERIVLRRWWRNQLDHMLENVTATTHPENIEAAKFAVQLIGLDMAGVDYITTDISRPYYETGGAFTEVNPMPALAGVQRCGMPAYRLLVEAFFPPGDDGRIPTAIVLGAGDIAPMLAAAVPLLAAGGKCIGVGALARFEVGGRPVRHAAAGEEDRVRAVLSDPRVTMAIVQATARTIGRGGLALDQCDVGVVMLAERRPAEAGAPPDNSDLQAAELIVAISRKAVVVNADDSRAATLIGSARDKRIFWVVPDIDGASDSQLLQPNDAAIAVSSTESGYFITVSDARGVARIAPAPEPMIGRRDADREVRRAGLTAIAIGCAFELPPAVIAEAIAAYPAPP